MIKIFFNTMYHIKLTNIKIAVVFKIIIKFIGTNIIKK